METKKLSDFEVQNDIFKDIAFKRVLSDSENKDKILSDFEKNNKEIQHYILNYLSEKGTKTQDSSCPRVSTYFNICINSGIDLFKYRKKELIRKWGNKSKLIAIDRIGNYIGAIVHYAFSDLEKDGFTKVEQKSIFHIPSLYITKQGMDYIKNNKGKIPLKDDNLKTIKKYFSTLEQRLKKIQKVNLKIEVTNSLIPNSRKDLSTVSNLKDIPKAKKKLLEYKFIMEKVYTDKNIKVLEDICKAQNNNKDYPAKKLPEESKVLEKYGLIEPVRDNYIPNFHLNSTFNSLMKK